jgi:4-amino-4-deoxy-L-arabinose transferase-like glycosyltransferase
MFNLTYRLGGESIKDWDEARHGVNAYEMIKNSNYIVNTFNYENDYYNLKPPLSYWGIILGLKIFGYNLIGFRAMSIFCAFLTIVIVAVFAYKRFGRVASLVSATVMATSIHFLQFHGARSGDADSMYIMLFTISIIAAINSYYKRSYIYITGLAFSLAFLAKSWHTMAIVAIVGLYLLIAKLILKFNLRQWLIFIGCSFGPILLWVLVRVRYDGFKFIHDMISYDLLSRTNSPIEGHTGPWYGYIIDLVENYRWYIAVFILLLFILIISKNIRCAIKESFNEYIGLMIWIVLPLILFSIAKTKLAWYIFPVYPPLALLIGCMAEYSIQSFRRSIYPVVLCLVILAAAGAYEYKFLRYIKNEPIDVFENYLRDNNISLDKYNSYVYRPTQFEGTDWNQRNVFALELFKDGRAKNGGIKEFLNTSKESILFLDNNEASLKLIKENNLKIIDSNNNIISVTKP